MPNYEFHTFITRCKSYSRPKSIHYISHGNERVILLVFQLLYLNNELTDPIFLFPFLKEHRCRLHYISFFSQVNYSEFGISHQRTTLIKTEKLTVPILVSSPSIWQMTFLSSMLSNDVSTSCLLVLLKQQWRDVIKGPLTRRPESRLEVLIVAAEYSAMLLCYISVVFTSN